MYMLKGLPREGNSCFPSWWCRTPSSLCKGASHHHKYFGEGKVIYVFILFSISEIIQLWSLCREKQLVSTLHSPLLGSLSFPSMLMIPLDQGFKMLWYEVHLVKFLCPLFEIWHPWLPFFDKKWHSLVWFK